MAGVGQKMGNDRGEDRRLSAAVAAGVLVTAGWWLALARVEAVPSLPLLAPAAGLCTALAVGLLLAGGGRSAAGTAPLATAAEAQLDRLDLLERRILSLGDPWPQVVVGPTGVFVVALGADGSGVTLGDEAVATDHAGLGTLVAAVRRRLGTPAEPDQDRLPVRGVRVVDDAAASAADPASDPDIEWVPVDGLAAHLADGPVSSMAAVERATRRLSGPGTGVLTRRSVR